MAAQERKKNEGQGTQGTLGTQKKPTQTATKKQAPAKESASQKSKAAEKTAAEKTAAEKQAAEKQAARNAKAKQAESESRKAKAEADKKAAELKRELKEDKDELKQDVEEKIEEIQDEVKNENKDWKHNVLNLLLAIVLIVSGAYTLARPYATVEALARLVGALFMVTGIAKTLSYSWQYFKLQFKAKDSGDGKHKEVPVILESKKEARRRSLNFVFGIILIVFGLFLTLQPRLTATLMTYLLAFWFVADGVLSLIQTFNWKGKISLFLLIISILLIAGGLIILFLRRPFLPISILIGVTLILDGIQKALMPFA